MQFCRGGSGPRNSDNMAAEEMVAKYECTFCSHSCYFFLINVAYLQLSTYYRPRPHGGCTVSVLKDDIFEFIIVKTYINNNKNRFY